MPVHVQLELRRVYDDQGAGHRVLVDRLWPRGVTKAEAALAEWMRDVAPSTELRRWYGHRRDRFDEFARRYRAELRRPPWSTAVARLVDLVRSGPITLVTATRDVEHSGAHVLSQVVVGRASRAHRRAPSRPAPDGMGRTSQSSVAGARRTRTSASPVPRRRRR